ncbi:MAG: hypothetical protein BWY47_01643 [Bacteroidetes bacterium ADurb.Bin302]|nr:MAG: hypothetical protein BWY47_01643 [Bacteroidetes bacterium ADurb.Bin302]
MELKTVIIRTKYEESHCTNVVALTVNHRDDTDVITVDVTFSMGIMQTFNDVLSYEVVIPDKDVPTDKNLYLLG